jgi:RNA polymerase sigma-70 factor (ECF subfamily)
MDRDSEAALIARLREGDHRAIDEVYDAYRGRLYSFLTRMTRSRQAADDLIEELWLRVVMHAPRLRPDTNLGAWLYTVARHLALNYARSRCLDHSVDLAAVSVWPASPAEPGPFERLAATELERRIEAGLASLPLMYREVLLLVAVEGLTTTEAAAACEITPEALRQRLSRARAMLSRAIERHATAPTRVLHEARS